MHPQLRQRWADMGLMLSAHLFIIMLIKKKIPRLYKPTYVYGSTSLKIGVVGSEGFLGPTYIGFDEHDELKRFDITGSSDGSVTKIDVARP